MAMNDVVERIAAGGDRYTSNIECLGECKLPSPVASKCFLRDGERVFVAQSELDSNHYQEKFGCMPTFERSGPHSRIYHDPNWTRVAIVTAGGLCPGLNTVIKGLVECLTFDYGVKNIYGIRYGYAGLNPSLGYEPLILDPDKVDTIHELGGTVLGSSRGQQPVETMVDTLVRMNINALFAIGGDGSLRCAGAIAAEIRRRGLKISVVGVPKTIDNDLMFVGRSFGFDTAVLSASEVIRNAHVEARGTANGVGLVKLMGRDSGFIAAAAAMANPVVNFCLIPEVRFTLEGEHGLLDALVRRFKSGKTHAVIVVAEGAGQELMEGAERRDASGNVLKKDIGEFLKNEISAHLKRCNIASSVKYFDPSYIIRSCPARGTDAIRCYMLARNAVHAAMAGRTDCVVGNVGSNYVLVPITLATIERQKVDVDGDMWRSVVAMTGQDYYFGNSSKSDVGGKFAP